MTGHWTPGALEALAGVMLSVAADLVCRVRDHDQTQIAAVLTPLDPVHLRALVVVLAAMVPADTPMGDLIAWTRTAPGGALEDITPKHAARNRAALAAELGYDDDYKRLEAM